MDRKTRGARVRERGQRSNQRVVGTENGKFIRAPMDFKLGSGSRGDLALTLS